MILDLDLYRAAKLLVDQQDEDALGYGDSRVLQLLEDGDLEGAAIWRAIMAAIEVLLRNTWSFPRKLR